MMSLPQQAKNSKSDVFLARGIFALEMKKLVGFIVRLHPQTLVDDGFNLLTLQIDLGGVKGRLESRYQVCY